jgi:hypothetical protein
MDAAHGNEFASLVKSGSVRICKRKENDRPNEN